MNNQVSKKNLNKGLRTGNVKAFTNVKSAKQKPNQFQTQKRAKPVAKTMVKRSRSHEPVRNLSGTYHKLERPLTNPKLCFALGNVAGGRMKTPWAETAATSDTPTQLLASNRSFSQDPGVATNFYTIITLCPYGAYNYNGGSPISVAGANNDSTALGLTALLGQTSMSTLFGTYTYSDRLVCFAASASISVLAPAANLSGIAYVGSIQVASMAEGTVVRAADLIQRASSTYNLSEKSVIDIRAGITNTAGIHQDSSSTGALNGNKEEWVSYIVIYNAARNITTGTLSQYAVNVAIQANAIISPDGAQPAIQGLVREIVDVPKYITPARNSLDEQNAECLARMNHSAELPSGWGQIVSYIKKGISIAGLVETGLSSLVPIARVFSTLLMGDSDSDDPLRGATANRVSDLHNNLDWYLSKIGSMASSTVFPENIRASLLSAMDSLQRAYDQSGDLLDLYEDYTSLLTMCRTYERWENGLRVIDHIDDDGNLLTWNNFKSLKSMPNLAIEPSLIKLDNIINLDKRPRQSDDSFHSSGNVEFQFSRHKK